MTRLAQAAVAAVGLCVLGGCGQKGALYLPDAAPQAVKTNPATPAPSEAPERRKTPATPDPATTQ